MQGSVLTLVEKKSNSKYFSFFMFWVLLMLEVIHKNVLDYSVNPVFPGRKFSSFDT